MIGTASTRAAVAQAEARATARLLGWWVAGLVGLAALFVVSCAIGKYPVAPDELLTLLVAKAAGVPHGLPSVLETVVFRVRLPRVAAAMLVGAGLAAAGAAYQGMFRNPLASPDIIGVSAGAALGAALGIFCSLPVVAIQALAFACGLGAVGAVWGIARAVRRADPVLVLVLAGIVVGTLLSATISLLKFLADPYDKLPAITFWLMGSLAGVQARDVTAAALPLTAGLALLVLLRWRLNVLSLPDEEARAMGVDTARLREAVIVGSTLMTSAAVAISGVVGWVGLVIPHLCRMLVGPDFRRLLPLSLLAGAGFLLAVDDVARLMATIEVPLGILTAALGAPFFLYMLLTARRGWR